MVVRQKVSEPEREELLFTALLWLFRRFPFGSLGVAPGLRFFPVWLEIADVSC